MAPITALSPRPPRTPTAGAIRCRRSPTMAFPRRWDTQKPTRPEPALWFPMATFGGGGGSNEGSGALSKCVIPGFQGECMFSFFEFLS